MTETTPPGPKPGHGDHWLAALAQSDPRLQQALTVPVDAPAGLKLHRSDLTESLDLVQVTRDRRLVTAYPEPRATALVRGRPIELSLWETRAEGWLTFEHETVGVLTAFVTDLAENAPRYAAAGSRRGIDVELSAIAYAVSRSRSTGPAHLAPGKRTDPRFLSDDYAFLGDVLESESAGGGDVLHLQLHGGLALPVVTREPTALEAGSRAQGFLWLTARLPDLRPTSKGA